MNMKKNMKKVLAVLSISFIVYACGGSDNSNTTNSEATATTTETTAKSSYDPNRGEGKFSSENVVLGASVDPTMVASGEKIQSVKCNACHKLTDEKLVGPGWKGVTERRKPEWIMNFITNPDPMIDKDPQVQASLELCLVRMPNQGLNDDDARNLLEFMRKNDGVK